MHINQFSQVVFKHQHYVFGIFVDCTFVRHFAVLQIQRLPTRPTLQVQRETMYTEKAGHFSGSILSADIDPQAHYNVN